MRTWWADGKRRLERCLGDVVRGVLTVARVLRQDRMEEESRRRKAEERERNRIAAIERNRLEQQKLDDLASRVLDHVHAEEIRGFLRSVEAYVAINGPVGPEPEISAWMEWARSVATSLQERAIRTLLTYHPPPPE